MPVYNIPKRFTLNLPPQPGSDAVDVQSMVFEAGVIELDDKTDVYKVDGETKKISDHWYFKANSEPVKTRKTDAADKATAKALADAEKLDDAGLKAALDAKKVDYPADADRATLLGLLKEAITIENA